MSISFECNLPTWVKIGHIMTKVPIIKIVHGYYPEQKLSRISALPQLNTKGRWVYGGIVNFKSAGRMFKMLLRLVVLKLGGNGHI